MKTHAKKGRRDRGYLLVGLLAMMTISLVVMAAALPQLKFESQREREEEMLWRGQEVAIALGQFSGMKGGQLPNTLEELVEGITVGVKKMRLLRKHALCDPMLPCSGEKSNWRLVHPGDQVIASMVSSLQAYQQKKKDDQMLVNQINQAIVILQRYAPRIQLPGQAEGLGGTSQDGQNPQNPTNPTAQTEPGRSLLGGLQSDQKPIVGIVSRSKDRTVRQILDLEQYDQELFYAGGIVIAGGFYTPYFAGTAGPQTPQVNPCPNGGFYLPDENGKSRCFGGLFDGQCPPPKKMVNGVCQ
ncbi:MAG: hypothetical protein HYR56_17605 [Acidobacteria bacterium]|nr:hypothetical protein [Acidobacteriota bacterium]MBI3426511.1 hypothetical protein [Acidobacteriota bacterium]